MDVYSAGTLNVSKRIWAAVSRFDRGFSGGSVNRTGCYMPPLVKNHSPLDPIPRFQPFPPPLLLLKKNSVYGTYLLTRSLQPLRIDKLPDPLHIIPIRHDAVLERIPDLQQSSQLLRPLPNEHIPLQCTREHA